ncbi:MAG: hypothetical protein EA377_10885 [Phycisphaerales bacterium]|nr:MAG: hypothetical protein EA377_10885 [Phycisphaerales bacterium]
MIDFPLRILLALTLAIVSPAWCCCTVRAIADEHAGIAPMGCSFAAPDAEDDRAADSAASLETGAALQRGCCSRGLIPATVAPPFEAFNADAIAPDRSGVEPGDAPAHERGAGPCCDPGQPEETSECKCDQRPSDLNRAEAGGSDLTLRVLTSSTPVVAIISEPARPTRPQLLNQPHAPPRVAFTLDPTLRSLRTLFLI